MNIAMATFLLLLAGASTAAAQGNAMQICAADAQRLCAASQGAARDDCMRRNAARLSAPCRGAMEIAQFSVWGGQGAGFGGPANLRATSGAGQGGQGGQQGGGQGGQGGQGQGGGGQGGQGGQQGGGGQGGQGQQGGN
jgi:hypothetical protein